MVVGECPSKEGWLLRKDKTFFKSRQVWYKIEINVWQPHIFVINLILTAVT
jgi:hypothetical protein